MAFRQMDRQTQWALESSWVSLFVYSFAQIFGRFIWSLSSTFPRIWSITFIYTFDVVWPISLGLTECYCTGVSTTTAGFGTTTFRSESNNMNHCATERAHLVMTTWSLCMGFGKSALLLSLESQQSFKTLPCECLDGIQIWWQYAL